MDDKKVYFNAIDLFKFLCSFLVCMIHIAPFSNDTSPFGVYLNFGLQQYICRLAVPFYFTCSGFFLFKKFSMHNINNEQIKNYCFKLLRFLGIWNVVLFAGETYHLWYLSATVLAIILLSLLLNLHVKFRYIFFIVSAFYIIGLLGTSYYGLIKPLKDVMVFTHLIAWYELLFSTTRNGIFMGSIFILMGALFAHKKFKISFKMAIFGFICSMFFLFIEITFLKIFSLPKDYDMYIFLIPATFFLFYIASNIKLKNNKIFPKLRVIGVLIFYLHLMVNYIINLAISFLKNSIGLDFSNMEFLITIILVTILAILIERLSNKKHFKWLNWLYT